MCILPGLRILQYCKAYILRPFSILVLMHIFCHFALRCDRTSSCLRCCWCSYHLHLTSAVLLTAGVEDMEDWGSWFSEATDALSVMFSRDYRYVVQALRLILQKVTTVFCFLLVHLSSLLYYIVVWHWIGL